MAELSESLSELCVKGGVALLVGLVIWSALVVAISLFALAGYSISSASQFEWLHRYAAVIALGAIALGYGERRIAALADEQG